MKWSRIVEYDWSCTFLTECRNDRLIISNDLCQYFPISWSRISGTALNIAGAHPEIFATQVLKVFCPNSILFMLSMLLYLLHSFDTKKERGFFVVYPEIKWPIGRLRRIADVMFQIHILTSKFCPIRKPHHIMLYELCVSLTHAISQSFVGYDLKHLLYSKCILSRQADHFDQHDHQTTPIRTINCKICNKFGQNHTLQYNIVRKMRLER